MAEAGQLPVIPGPGTPAPPGRARRWRGGGRAAPGTEDHHIRLGLVAVIRGDSRAAAGGRATVRTVTPLVPLGRDEVPSQIKFPLCHGLGRG